MTGPDVTPAQVQNARRWIANGEMVVNMALVDAMCDTIDRLRSRIAELEAEAVQR